jgi:hypothetical protein
LTEIQIHQHARFFHQNQCRSVMATTVRKSPPRTISLLRLSVSASSAVKKSRSVANSDDDDVSALVIPRLPLYRGGARTTGHNTPRDEGNLFVEMAAARRQAETHLKLVTSERDAWQRVASMAVRSSSPSSSTYTDDDPGEVENNVCSGPATWKEARLLAEIEILKRRYESELQRADRTILRLSSEITEQRRRLCSKCKTVTTTTAK